MTKQCGAETAPPPTVPRLRQKPSGLPLLMAHARAGQQDAFTRLKAHTRPLTYTYLYFCAGNGGTADALIARTYDRAEQELGHTSPYADPALWLLRIAREVATTHFREPFRMRAEIGELSDDEGAITNATLLAAIRTLSPVMQERVVLRHMFQLSPREIAIVTGSTPTAVSRGLTRSTTSLRAAIRAMREAPSA